MACLNSFDLIAYPGIRYSQQYKALDAAEFASFIAGALESVGWVTRRAGTGYQCLSRAVPYCGSGATPAAFVGRALVTISLALDSIVGPAISFDVTNMAQDMPHTSSLMLLRLNTGFYAPWTYYLTCNPYDFTLFMLGVQKRADLGYSNQYTSIMAGVPQIPSFLAERPAAGPASWCQCGINELYYCAQIDEMRDFRLSSEGAEWVAGISKYDEGGEDVKYFNHQNGPFQFSYGVGVSTPGLSNQSGYWIHEHESKPDRPQLWGGMMFPPLIQWRTIPGVEKSNTFKGFGWDKLIVNKPLPGDALFTFDGHTFIVVSNNIQGGTLGAFVPPGSLLCCIGGPV